MFPLSVSHLPTSTRGLTSALAPEKASYGTGGDSWLGWTFWNHHNHSTSHIPKTGFKTFSYGEANPESEYLTQLPYFPVQLLVSSTKEKKNRGEKSGLFHEVILKLKAIREVRILYKNALLAFGKIRVKPELQGQEGAKELRSQKKAGNITQQDFTTYW